MKQSKRLQSLDALRGFDMLFIMGLAGLITAICNLFPGGSDCWLARQMVHADWSGLTHHDTIFPLFLFLAGVSFPFSYEKSLSKGKTGVQIYRKVILRALTLYFLGLVCGGFFKFNHGNLRLLQVLGRIGFAWMFAAIIFMNTGYKTRIVISAVLLVGYRLLLLIPAPDAAGASPLSLEGNIVGYIDRTVLGTNHLFRGGVFDPEGMLSTVPAIVTALLGMFAGELIRCEKFTGGKKTLIMLGIAAGLLVSGLLWSLDFPINKKLWTSTFVMVVGAYSFAMMALFYYIIDVKGHKGWILPLTVVGMNSITIYMAQRIVDFGKISNFFLGGITAGLPELWGKVIGNAGYILVCWLFLYFLYKKKVFLKV